MTIDEGYTKFTCDWHRGELPEFNQTAELCRWRKLLFDAGLIGFYAEHGVGFGNISVRIDGRQEFLISGTQTGHIANVDAGHFALVTATDIERNRVSCRGPVQASSESMTHAAIYQIDSKIGAVVHVHSEILWRTHLGILPTTSAEAPYGTPAMAGEFCRIYRETSFQTAGIAVMGGHDSGLIGIGDSLAAATNRILDLHHKLQYQ